MKAFRLLSIAALVFILASAAWADTEVSSITALPDPFNPDVEESTTITVEATSGVTGLEIRVVS